jgi:hypothetical protein
MYSRCERDSRRERLLACHSSKPVLSPPSRTKGREEKKGEDAVSSIDIKSRVDGRGRRKRKRETRD